MAKEQNNLIVIAEDSRTQAEKLKFLLNGFGYEVVHGINGREAFDLTKKYLPIMIITDIIMPVMDGYELCKKTSNHQVLGNRLYSVGQGRAKRIFSLDFRRLKKVFAHNLHANSFFYALITNFIVTCTSLNLNKSY